MIKSKLIDKLASKMTHLPEKRIMEGVNIILEHMSNQLVDGQRIEIRGFGSFSPRYHKPRQAHNPKTGEKILTEGKNAIHFKPGKELKIRVETSQNKCDIHETE